MTKIGFNPGRHFTNTDLDQAQSNVQNDPFYGPAGKLIKACLQQFPENTEFVVVAMKICLIDYTNSTNLSKFRRKVSLDYLARLIIGTKDFDVRVASYDPTLIGDLTQKTKTLGGNGKGINLFSFISKYCCYHNYYVYGRNDYSIYDRVLERFLSLYNKNASAKQLRTLKDKFDYAGYNDVIEKILQQNRISSPNARRKFDYLVWYGHRSAFNKPKKGKPHL